MNSLLGNFLFVLLTPFRLLFIELPFKIIQAPRRLVGLSVPARVAIMVAIFLIICVVTVAVAYRLEPSNVPWHDFLTAKRVLVILALIVAIPIVVYKALQLWLEGEVSRFPDIDYAWKAGVAELQAKGIDVTMTPLFLVLGVHDSKKKPVVEAARLRLRVQEIPAGPAALHWYASPEAIYIFCTETSCLNKLVALAQKLEAEGPILSADLAAAASPNIRGTIMPGAEPADSIRMSGTAPEPRAGMNIRGTMMVGGAAEADDVTSAGVPEKAVAHLEPQVTAEQSLRLEYLCQLIRRAREPLCPINGILSMLPYSLIKVGPGGAREVQKAVRADISTLTATLKLRSPVSAVIGGMESENGFRELVRRVGLDRAGAQRFGKGFGIWNPPIPEQLEAVCAHACGAFEDWVYSLFKEKGSLGKEVGNKKLYSLLCSVRRDIKDRLTNLVVAGYGSESKAKERSDSQLFSGCYFSATGDVEYHQAFLKGVFDKLIEQQEEVEWTQEAIAEDRRCLHLAYYAIGIDAILFIALAAMLVSLWLRK